MMNAFDLAEALGRRSLEFRYEEAETLALIAGLCNSPVLSCSYSLHPGRLNL